MNRPVPIAAFAFLLSISIPLFAQHGGGGHAAAGGGGGHAAFGGGHAGFSGGGGARSFSGARAGSGFAARSRSFSGPYARNHSGVGVRIRSYGYGYGRNCRGAYGCGLGYGYPYLYGGVDPYWWWENDSNAQPDPGAAYGYDNGLANEMQDQGMPVRPAPDSGDEDYYARATPPSPQPESQAQPGPSTVLVFRDQHQEEVQNYAIVGQTLWNFTSGHTQKIPLSELDVPATQKTNDDRGVEFRLPGGSEGQ
jgi:hypothetical protein